MEDKKTLVIGASEKASRYSNMAVHLLNDNSHSVYAYGLRKGVIGDLEIKTDWPENEKFNTVTMYISPRNQVAYYDRIVALKPKRVIFNPGTENPALIAILLDNNIEVVENCTLVMINSGIY
jgi:predicted CoA-binding protein